MFVTAMHRDICFAFNSCVALFCRAGGARMQRFLHRGWRRVLACVILYALVLQGFLYAVAVGEPALGAADNAAWAGVELCVHGGHAATLPGAPAQAPTASIHCLFCIAGAVYVNCAPPAAPRYSRSVLVSLVRPLAAPRLVALLVNESAWPRGPPTQV